MCVSSEFSFLLLDPLGDDIAENFNKSQWTLGGDIRANFPILLIELLYTFASQIWEGLETFVNWYSLQNSFVNFFICFLFHIKVGDGAGV